MDAQRRRLIFKPNEQEKQLPFMARVAFAMRGAHQLTAVTAETHPEFKQLLDSVSEKVGVPTPQAFIWDTKFADANALAMNTEPPLIAFSRTATQLLNPEEMAAVTAHELGHVKNQKHSGKLHMLSGLGGLAISEVVAKPIRDQLDIQRVKGGITGGVDFMAKTAIFTGQIFAARVGAAVASRSEEYAADRHVALAMDGNPIPLISALDKLSDYSSLGVEPPKGMKQKVLTKLNHWTRSHPTLEARCEALGVTPQEVTAYQQANQSPAQAAAIAASEPQVEATSQTWQNKETVRQAEQANSLQR